MAGAAEYQVEAVDLMKCHNTPRCRIDVGKWRPDKRRLQRCRIDVGEWRPDKRRLQRCRIDVGEWRPDKRRLQR
ncbi:hypothetical protein J6590_006512 [Homalodisca vitripennis]|nr:hypothetical protein J6590_006512 [Homalodisca vitripennis]